MKRQTLISLIEKFRRFLYFCHRLPSKGLMPQGIPCQVEEPEDDIIHGDVVHPCVRYIEEGFEGHQWWMVYTPFYGGDNCMENPRLCYADSEMDTPPTKWKYYCTIRERQQSGYNSDPTMLFHQGSLYVFWRECHTQTTQKIGCNFATFGCVVRDKTVKPLPKVLLPNFMGEVKKSHDREVSPTFMVVGNQLKAFAMHQKFDPDFVFRLPAKWRNLLYRYHIFYISDTLGIYNKIKNVGVAIWDGNSFNNQFQYIETVKFKHVSRLYQPWHMDLFQADRNMLYAVVQTSQNFADICLACCEDGRHFHLFKKPLLTSGTIGMSGLYKPTALVDDGKIHIYYTAHDNQDFKLNRLFVTSVSWETLLTSISID